MCMTMCMTRGLTRFVGLCFLMWGKRKSGWPNIGHPPLGNFKFWGSYFSFFQSFVMSSRVFPLVSGTSLNTNRAAAMQMTP